MLLKSNIGQAPFRKAIKIRMWVSVIFILIGLKCILLVLLNQVGELQSLTANFGIDLVNISFMEGFYTGFGSALIIASICIIIKNIMLLKNEKKFKKAEIEYIDERNQFIRDITFITTSYIFMVILAFAVVISGMFNAIVFVTLLVMFFIYALLLLLTYLIYNTKY